MSDSDPVVPTETNAEIGSDDRPTPNRARCDFCGSARTRNERNRLVWHSRLAAGLVLAELCSRCAAHSGALLEVYGGHGRNAIRLEQQVRAAPPPTAARHRAFGFTAHAIAYVLIAMAAFVLVTLVTSLGR